MAIPLSFHRITKPYFRTCSTCMSRSQAPFCLYTLRAILSALREPLDASVTLSERPPQSNCPPDTVLSFVTSRVRSLAHKVGIPTATPISLGAYLLRLPTILYVTCQKSMSGCSKAPWGLSVQSRVTCIFTGISISPGPSLRQCPSRYTFRAGRNLPDKEFRYLRTVIVTAAVYWGFNSKLLLANDLSS